MTATSLIVQAEAVIMIADTAGADLAGNFAGHASRELSLGVASHGRHGSGNRQQNELVRCRPVIQSGDGP